MTRQRKTHLAILALVPLVVFGAVRCADSTGTSPQAVGSTNPAANAGLSATLAKLHAENDWAGKYHNDALSYVLASLDRIPAKSRDRLTICETARKAYREFHKSRRGSDEPTVVDNAFEDFCVRGSSPRQSNAVLASSGGATPRSADAYATQQFMDQFHGAIDASVSYDDLSARINSIDAAAAGTLSSDEAASVIMVGSITLSSADYWATNMPAWDPFVGTDTGFLTVLATSRAPGTAGGFGPSRGVDWAGIWNDTKAAAKRAAHGDLTAAAKAVVTIGVAGGVALPAAFDVVLSASATGSVMAVLQF